MDGHTSLAMFQRCDGRETGTGSNRCEIKEEERETNVNGSRSKTGKQKGIQVCSKTCQENTDKDTVELRALQRTETRKDGIIAESQHRDRRYAAANLASNNMRPKIKECRLLMP